MKTKEELNALKEELEALSRKLQELTDEELAQVSGGLVPGITNEPDSELPDLEPPVTRNPDDGM